MAEVVVEVVEEVAVAKVVVVEEPAVEAILGRER